MIKISTLYVYIKKVYHYNKWSLKINLFTKVFIKRSVLIVGRTQPFFLRLLFPKIVLVSRIQTSGTGDNNFESEGRNFKETRNSNSNVLFRLAFCIFSLLLWVARDYSRDHWIKTSDFFLNMTIFWRSRASLSNQKKVAYTCSINTRKNNRSLKRKILCCKLN